MNWQYVIVFALVVFALYFIGRNIFRSAKGNTCESGSCKCHPADMKTKS